MLSGVIAVIALLANVVSVDGICSYPSDGKSATVGDMVLKEDADGVMTIPANWTAIPSFAFSYCPDLKKVVIPANITKIEGFAFNDSAVEVVKFEANSQLVSIGSNAFDGTNIISIEIPKSVTEIQYAAFALSALEEVEFEANSALASLGSSVSYFLPCIFRS